MRFVCDRTHGNSTCTMIASRALSQTDPSCSGADALSSLNASVRA